MIICGLDASMNGTGAVKLHLNDSFDVVNTEFLGFTTVKKNVSDGVIHYNPKDFNDAYEKDLWIIDKIIQFVRGSEYVVMEGYAYAFGKNAGRAYNIGQFSGLLKYIFYVGGLKIRLHDPKSVKMFATNNGSANKMDMYNALIEKHGKFASTLSNLPKIPDNKHKEGISPTSDVVDAYFLAEFLRTELLLRHGLIELKSLPLKQIEAFNRVSDANPVNILSQDFIEKRPEFVFETIR